ncbi:MAG: glycosyltransferase [Microcoleus sp.]
MLKTSKPILTLGRVDIATINDRGLRLDGWVASFNSGSVSAFKVSIAGIEVDNIEQTLGIASPDIQEIYPDMDSAANARFSIQIPIIKWDLIEFLVIVTPLFNGREGNLLVTVLNPSLPKPTEEYIAWVGSDFDVSYYFLAYFIQMGGLSPTDRVLDIGCGVGRLAYSLAYYLKRPGAYEGFDLIWSLIDWAQKNITSRFPHFNFRSANIYNQIYNPTGTVQAEDFIFPYPDRSFDFIFLTSVFTHMQAREVQHYLQEIKRVLKVGGRCLFTCFLLNEDSESAIVQGRSSLDISYQLEDCFTNNVAVSESAIGYKEPLILQWIEDCGLEVIGKYYGYWCGRRFYTSMQDIVIIEKKRSEDVQNKDDDRTFTPLPIHPPENSLELIEVIPSLGSIDVVEVIENQGLHLYGWAISLNAGTLDGFKILIAGKEFVGFELTLDIASPDVKKAYPDLEGSENARFCIRIPMNYKTRDSLVSLTPLFKDFEGRVLCTIIEPSLPVPSDDYMSIVGGGSPWQFDFLAFLQRVGLSPTDRVLDVGCGLGRLAYNLAYYLKQPGRYEGFDIIEKLVDWAQKAITPRFPHFRFRQVDIYNQFYNPTGSLQSKEFRFPYPSNWFDFIVLNSVFTHIQAEETRHYLDEIERVLKPGGRCLCSWFLLNEESELLIGEGKSTHSMIYELEECFTSDPQAPEGAIGFKEKLLFEWIAERNLTVADKFYGLWCGRTPLYWEKYYYQDILLLQKNKEPRLRKPTQGNLKRSQTFLEEKKLQPIKPIAIFSYLEQAVVKNEILHLDGWVVSVNFGLADGFKVCMADSEVCDFEVTLGIPSPDVKQAYPDLEGAENARFSIQIPLNSQQQEQFGDSRIILTPLFKGDRGAAIETRMSFVNREDEKQNIINGHPETQPSQPQLHPSPQQEPLPPILQQIQADLEPSGSYSPQIMTALESSGSPVPPVNPEVAPVPQPIVLTETQLHNTTQNLKSYYPNLLGLSEVSVEKFWHILNPVIESQLPYANTTTPKISIITPTWNSSLDWFVETALSVLTQSIADWEWCIADDGSKTPEIRSVLADLAKKVPRIKIAFKEPGGISSATNHALNMASADYVCFLDHDDTLVPTALQDSLDKLSEGFDAIYSDEDKIDFSGLDYVESFFKPDWSPEYFRGVMYAGHLLSVRRELALAVGGFKSEYDGVQDYEFLLRISEVTNKIGHISKMLYHWRKIPGSIAGDINAKSGIEPLQQAGVNSNLQRLGLPAKAEPGVGGHRVNINPLPRNHNPLVSIIIAVKDAYVPLEDCLKNIISQSTYPNFEVLVVESETADTPKSLNGENQISVKSIKLPQPFTPARAYNLGSKSARGEYLVFLSDIAEIITEDWLRHLLYYAEQPDVGAVGSLLLSADRIVQHAGLVLGDKSTVNWVMKGFPANSDGYAGSLVCAREVSAVTDSCMMVKKSEFERIGGFNEHFFTYYQDIDFCLRLKKEGKRIILTPRSVLISHEPGRRQRYDDSVDRMLLLDHWEMDIEQGDAYYNPNFNSERNDYTIRA